MHPPRPLTTALLGILVGCSPIRPKPDSGTPRFSSEDPAITGLRVACDPTSGVWDFGVRTDAWVGTARIWMGTTPTSLEQHVLSVDVSSPTASWDCWSTSVRMAVDLDNPGSDTRFGCRQSDTLHMLLAVSDEAAERWTDCRRWGPDPSFWDDAEGTPACDQVIDEVLTPEVTLFESGNIAQCR